MYIEVAAHRGNVFGYPENSIPAFESAYEINADSIELDLRMTADGEIVIIHDNDLARTSDIEGKIKELTLEQINKADIGIKTDEKFKGTRVPTFREFLELTKRDEKMTFNFEFKDYFHKEGEEFAKKSADKIIALIDEYDLSSRCYVNSFDGALLKYIDDKYEGKYRLHGFYPFEILGDIYPGNLYCACLWKRRSDPSEDVVNQKADFDALKSLGIHPWVGASIKAEVDVVKAVEYGAELFTSNEPEILMDILKKHGFRNR